MPEFIPEGPYIPEEITRALEDERLILFCGAGVSIPAGYPTFPELVEIVRKKVPISNDRLVEAAIKNQEYSSALGLIEKKTHTEEVRSVVREILSKPPKNIKVHKTILELSSLKNGHVRGVTTNLDELFCVAGAKPKISNLLIDSAPKLPLAKQERWNSLVHLHGRINDSEVGIGRNWVLTSSDFGEAYITEGYCSRFVTELFRHFVVLFVGYSVNDPVMKYLIDALRVAIQRGENFNHAYAFAEWPKNKNRDYVEKEWESKGIIPIPYLVKRKDSHFRLYKTLEKWAEHKRKGLSSRASIVLDYTRFEANGFDDPTTQQVVWALKEDTGKVAGKLADFSHKVPVSWLNIFDEAGLLSMGKATSFSTIHSGDMGQQENSKNFSGTRLVSSHQSQHVDLHPITYNLARWLIKYLSTKEVLYWVLTKGPVIHRWLRWLIRGILEDQKKRPNEPFLTLWNVLISNSFQDLYAWQEKYMTYGLIREGTPLANQELLGAITLCPRLRPTADIKSPYENKPLKNCKELISVDFEFVDRKIENLLKKIIDGTTNIHKPQNLVEPLTEKLVRGMEWLEILEFANEDRDPSIYEIPSISSHPQNKHAKKWTLLIELIRKCFEALLPHNRPRAESIATYWSELTYPVFKRLALYAATEIQGEWKSKGVELLLKSNAQLLWSDCVRRETLRFLRKAAKKLEEDEINSLCREILNHEGIDFPSGISGKTKREISDHSIWQRLKKLQVGGAILPEEVVSRIKELEKQHGFVTDTENKDEFNSYRFGPEYIDYDKLISDEEFEEFKLKSPKERLAILDALKI